MPEQPAPERIRGVYDVVRHIERIDPNIHALRQLRESLQQQFDANRSCIADGTWAEIVEYDLPDYIPLEKTTYPVDITRHGEFVSRHPQQFPHMLHRHDVPGVIKLTAGDLEAAVEWGMYPVLQPDKRRHPQANELQAMIEDMNYRAVMRRLFVARLMLSEQIWQHINLRREAGANWKNIVAEYDDREQEYSRPLTRADLEQELMTTGMVAERITFTMAARLGSRVVPPFRPFRARAGVDMNEHVDLLLRVTPEDTIPTLAAIDVTAKSEPEYIWKKTFVQQAAGRSAQSGTLRDPATLREHLPTVRSVLATPHGADWPYGLRRWSDQRGHTAITPEYMLRADHRTELGRKILWHVKQPNGQPYYDDATIHRIYQMVYGQWDIEHP